MFCAGDAADARVDRMMKKVFSIAILFVAGAPFVAAQAQDIESEVAELRQLITEMKADYEQRISDLENRLARAERQRVAGLHAELVVALVAERGDREPAGIEEAAPVHPRIGLDRAIGRSVVGDDRAERELE